VSRVVKADTERRKRRRQVHIGSSGERIIKQDRIAGLESNRRTGIEPIQSGGVPVPVTLPRHTSVLLVLPVITRFTDDPSTLFEI